MVASCVRAGRGVTNGVLRVQLAANFVDGFFDGTVLKGSEVRTSGSGGGDLARGLSLDRGCARRPTRPPPSGRYFRSGFPHWWAFAGCRAAEEAGTSRAA